MRRARGFTLLEVLIALSIVGLLLTIAFSGLRVATAAWRQGEDRVEAHQHVRALALTLSRGLGAAYPYRGSKTIAPDIVTLFDGAADRVAFVTQTAPFPLPAPVAFTAVVVTLEPGEGRGLVVRERALPNQEPFDKAEIVMQDPAVTALTFKYLDDGGQWTDTWDGTQTRTIPRAVQIQLSATLGGRPQTLPPVTVTLRAAPVSQ
jgi:general secretion pathway protein J